MLPTFWQEENCQETLDGQVHNSGSDMPRGLSCFLHCRLKKREFKESIATVFKYANMQGLFGELSVIRYRLVDRR